MQNSYSHTPQSSISVQSYSSNQNYTIGNTVVCSLALFLPSCLVLGAVFYKRYRVHRAATLRRQIEKLELMWQISPKQ